MSTAKPFALDLNKLAAAIENTKRAALLWRNPPDQSHLDDLLARLRKAA